jgi:hypothetical protein
MGRPPPERANVAFAPTFTLKTSSRAPPNEVLRNPHFMKEAQAIAHRSRLYAASTATQGNP